MKYSVKSKKSATVVEVEVLPLRRPKKSLSVYYDGNVMWDNSEVITPLNL